MLLLGMMVLSCKKKPAAPFEEEKPGGVKPVAHGTVVGLATEQTIGPGGGQLTIVGTKLKLSVPAGALDGEVKVTVSEVTNTLPNGAVGKAYRFLPENVQFKKDVEITLPYEPLTNTSPQALHLAYQDGKGYWHMVKEALVDENNRTVTAKTRHFSDWGAVANLYIKNNGKNALDKSQSTELEIAFLPSVSDDDLLAPDVPLDASKVKQWRIAYGATGYGTVTGGQSTKATYTAPATLTVVKTATVEVELQGVGEKPLQPVILQYKVKLRPDEYCLWTFNNEYLFYSDRTDVWYSDKMYVNFYGNKDSYRFHIEAPTQTFGVKPFGENKAFVSSFVDGHDYYASTYNECGSSEALFTDGQILVTGVENGLVSGEVSGQIRFRDPSGNCYKKSFVIWAEFRYRKK